MKKLLLLISVVFSVVACSTESATVTTSALVTTTSQPQSTQTATKTQTTTPENRATQIEKSRLTKTAQANLTETILALTPSPPPKVTFAPKPTNTPSSIPTITTSPSPTPTYDKASAVTVTPASPAICPEYSADAEIPDFYDKSPDEFEAIMRDLLNAGALREILADRECRSAAICLEKEIASQDLTGDNVPELIITGGSPFQFLYVFGCQEGDYITLLAESPVYEYGPTPIEVKDLNLNGLKDLVVEHVTCHWCLGVKVFEWQKDHFESLVWQEYYPGSGEFIDIAELDGYSSAEIIDVDKNGTYEIVLDGGIPSWSGGLWGFDGPYRSQKVVYSWNGAYFSQISHEYGPPRFRFEAVQDGDMATERGEFEKALSFYQDAIFSDQLSSWTNDEWFSIMNDPNWECCNPPDPKKLPFNQVEYSQLAAYARYRIMLLHAFRGWDNEAQIVYDTLVEKFPLNDPGYPYVQLATEFWNEYQLSRNIIAACWKAIDFAEINQEILEPLGNDHGLFSKFYQPESICPFK